MINKANLKFYLIPATVLMIILLIILAIPMNKKRPNEQPNTAPTQIPLPKRIVPTYVQINGPTPTPILIQDFTGVDINQELPTDVKNIGLQKTALRKLTPLTLPLGKIDFDYTNDRFILTLNEPKDQSQKTFSTWLQQTYPAIPIEQFAIQ